MKTLTTFRAPRLLRVVLVLTLAAGGSTAHAQLRLPSVNVPLPGGLGQFPGQLGERLGGDLLADPVNRLGRVRELADVRAVRLEQVARLLRQHGKLLEADPRGEPAVRRELLATMPSQAALDAAAAAGLSVLRETRLDDLDQLLVVLRVPDGLDIALLVAQLRLLDPDGAYDFNHVYTGSGGAGGASGGGANGGPANGGPANGGPANGGPAAPEQAAPASRKAGATRVGLVDSGVDAGHEVFRASAITRWGCDDKPYPDAHGTAVAALMVGQSRHFRGVAPQAQLYAADIYCASGTGGSAERIAGALAWMAKQNVPVINMSIVGPSNQTLERVVGAMVKRGHLLVAAVGNDGPAAPPLYPASYPGVVGVSAVDRRGRVLPEAGRGRQVMFAAPGHHMVSATPGAPPYRQVRGTSYASPIVAALLAERMPQPDKGRAADALAVLAGQAVRADGAAVSNESGLGVVGQTFRIDPDSLR